MRNGFRTIALVFLFPLVLGWGMARAADQQDAGGFKIVLSDGSLLNGAVSFLVNLDTEYGQIKIPSSSLVSARFDVKQEWADVRLNGAELKMKYKPASSDLNVTLAMGPLKIALTKVVSIENPSAEASNRTPGTPSQANVQQPPVGSVPQPPPETASPPVTVYQYPYQYAQPAPYYYDYPYYGYYDYGPYYGLGYGYYGWPYIGLGFGWGWGHGYHGGFGRGFGGFHGGFGGRHR
jgi:hypothetical protein